jgi:hypothetical protein
MFRLPCGEGDKAQNRSNGVVGETYTHHQAVLKSVIHQKQVIADSSGQAATVWDARRSTSLIFWERVQPSFLKKLQERCHQTKKRKPLGSAIEEFVFGTKEAASPTPPFVVLPAPTPTASLTPFALLPASIPLTTPPPFALLLVHNTTRAVRIAPDPVPIQSKEPSLMSKLQAPDKEATVRFTVDMSETLHRKLSMLAAKTGRKKVDQSADVVGGWIKGG